jgi:asparagine synthase (glutamine-hydrolysing)
MCGLTGIVDGTVGASELRNAVNRMTESLGHRGPDDRGVFARDGIALGHRRLSILDLTSAGAQPMTLERAGVTVVFNGEAYNFLDLRNELEERGHRFEGRSDTEVVIRMYAESGLEGLRRLEGIFGLAIWDDSRKRLVLMRDRLGVKPLYYARVGARLVFGSEIKALFAAGTIDRTVDDQALSEYLWFGNAYEDRSIYQKVKVLLPGHWLIREEELERTEPWWRIEEWLPGTESRLDRTEAAAAVRDAIDEGVRRQLVADVPVGIFLSGGLDSSSIAAAAMHVQSKPLSSFSVGFDFDGGINELPQARCVADHLGLDHHEVSVSGADLEGVLRTLSRSHDEPFGDAANIPLFLLAKQIQGEIKVVLQGDGGDEMFGGYRRYSVLRYAGLWGLWPTGLTPLIRAGFGGLGKRLARMAEAVNVDDHMGLLLTTETIDDSPLLLLHSGVRQRLERNTDPFDAYRRCARRFNFGDPVQQMLLTDITLQLPSQFLAKVDRATMACGLEARVPLLDETVARLAVGLPSKWKVNGMKKKLILRESQRDRLPREILDRRKTGFGVPYEYWLREPLHDFARTTVLRSRFLRDFGFDSNRIEAAFAEHKHGVRDRGFTLWKILQLALWSEDYQ